MNNPYLTHYDPYAGYDFSPAGGGYNPQADHLANLDAQRQREAAEKEQREQSTNNFSNQLSEYMNQGTAQPTTNPYMGSAPGMVAGAPGVNAAGGTLQASMSAPLAQAAPFTAQGIGGGSVAGPMSMAPTANMSMAPAAAGGGGAAGGGAGAGAGAGGAGLGTAGLLAIPAAAMAGSMDWEQRTGTNTVGDSFKDPLGSSLDRTDLYGGAISDAIGNFPGAKYIGDAFGAAVQGTGGQVVKAGEQVWDWLSGLF